MRCRDAVPEAVSDLLDGRPVRWRSSAVGDYDGRERTLEVFEADAAEQLDLLRALRPMRAELADACGGPVVVPFHTRRESRRLHADYLAGWRRARLDLLKHRLAETVMHANDASGAAAAYEALPALEEELARLQQEPNVVPVSYASARPHSRDA